VYETTRRWRSDDLDEGATAVEYALLVGLIAVIIIS
jgi:pilus assembly protein Flp/PilA